MSVRASQNRWNWGTVATIEAYSNPRVLLLDFDLGPAVPNLIVILARLRVIGLRARWVSYRRTTRGWHMEIGINAALVPSDTVACQAILGSDPAREAMNLRRARSLNKHKHKRFWRKRWNILFDQKTS